MRGLVLLPLLLAGGCATHRVITEQVATGHGSVTTRGTAGASELSAAPGGGGMPLPRGTYDFELRIGVPRAQLVDWKLQCGDDVKTGTVGQAFDEYKEQRLSYLTKEREQQAKIYARAMVPARPTAVVVAQPPLVRVKTPAGRVVVQPAPVVVQSEAAREPEPPAEVEVPPVTELPPGDLGQGVYPARVRVVTPADGVCAISAVADDGNVSAFYSVTRVRDLGVEAAERKQVVYVGAVNTRGRMTERLVALGADPQAKQKRLEAEARARAELEARRGAELARQREAELRVNLELRRKAEAEASLRRERDAVEAEARADREALELEARERAEEEQYAIAWEAEAPARARADLLIYQKEVSIKWRLTVIAWLVSNCNADPDRRGRIARARAQREAEQRARLEIRLEIERVERERLIRIRMEQDRLERRREAEELARRDAERNARRAERENREAIERARRDKEARELAELELRRTNAAIQVRTNVVGALVAFGAKIRPPMPAPQLENPGPTPFDGAEWAAGRWEWNSIRTEWQWRGGGWRDTMKFSRNSGETVARETVVVEPPVVVEQPVVTTTVVSTPSPTVIVAPPQPAVVIEVGRPGYQPRPRPTRPAPAYQPRPSRPAPAYQPQPSQKRPRKDDDDKRRR